MTEEELKQIATRKDLENLHQRIIKDVTGLIKGKDPLREFYSPKEWGHITGEPYSSVIKKCKTGRLKARQDDFGCTWQIDATELERYKKESE